MVNSEAMWIYGIAFSPDGAAIAAGNADKSIKIYDINNGQILKTLTGHNAEVHAIAFSPDSQNLVSVSRDNSIKIWNAETLNFSELVARGCQMLKAHTANSPHPDRDKICR
jgi:WD40 repeat protein